MSATAWLIIAIVGFSLSGVAFVAAIILFIRMNIPAIIGDLSGKSVAREIKAMRESNTLSGNKGFKPSVVNMERGMLTEKVNDAQMAELNKKNISVRSSNSEKPVRRAKGTGTVEFGSGVSVNAPEKNASRKKSTGRQSGTATDVLSTKTEVLSTKTELLSDEEEAAAATTSLNTTTVLDSPATTPLNVTTVLKGSNSDGGTTVLNATTVLNGTTVLSSTAELETEDVKPVAFKVTRSEVIVHSDEVI